MPTLPDRLEMKTKSGEMMVLEKQQSDVKFFGLAPKAIYQCDNGNEKNSCVFFVKLPKERKLNDIFASAVPMNKRNEYLQHKAELEQTHVFLEVLAPRIAKAICKDALIVPENYFLLPAGKNRTPMILSKKLLSFNEFLSEEKVAQGKNTSADWDIQKLPMRNDLQLTPQKAEILGKLLFVALLVGHWDIFNICNFSNSGSFKTDDGRLLPAIVDWGNSLGNGFCGLSAEESAFQNPDLVTGSINFADKTFTGFQHCVPFDELVYPLLPRQIVKDLFNLDNDDVISRAILNGFMEFNVIAQKTVNDIDKIIKHAIQETLLKFTAIQNIGYVKKVLLNQEVYFPKKNQKSNYTLANILRGRIASIGKIIEDLEKGSALDRIAQKRFEELISAQLKFSSPIKLGIFSSSVSAMVKSSTLEITSPKENQPSKIKKNS